MKQNTLSVQDWSALIAQQEESSLTIERFCQSKGVTTGRFYYYKKKLQSQFQENSQGFLQASIYY